MYKGSDTGIGKSYEILRDIEGMVFNDAGDFNNDGLDDMVIGEPTKKGAMWTQLLGSRNGVPDSKPFLKYELTAGPTSDAVYNKIAGNI